MHTYRLYQFWIESEIRLPCQSGTGLQSNTGLPGLGELPVPVVGSYPEPRGGKISIRLAPKGSLRTGPKVLHPQCHRHQDGFLILTSHGALQVDHSGCGFVVDASPEEQPVLAQWFVHVGFAYTLIQHGCWPVHAACLQISKNRDEVSRETPCIGIVANSGAGKSTLAWHWLQRGALFGADDLLLAYPQFSEPGQDNQILTYPCVSLRPKLSEDAALRAGLTFEAGLDEARLERAEMGEASGKPEYLVSLEPHQRQKCIAPLRGLVVLNPQVNSPEDEIVVRSLEGKLAAALLLKQTHGLWLFGTYLETRLLWQRVHTLRDHLPIWELTYRRTPEILDALCQSVVRLCEV